MGPLKQKLVVKYTYSICPAEKRLVPSVWSQKRNFCFHIFRRELDGSLLSSNPFERPAQISIDSKKLAPKLNSFKQLIFVGSPVGETLKLYQKICLLGIYWYQTKLAL